MNVLIDLCMGRANLVQEAIRRWQSDHQESQLVSDIEELCRESVELCRLCKRAGDVLWNALFDSAMFNTEKVGRDFQRAVDQSLQIVRTVIELVRETKGTGHCLSGADQLADEMKRLELVQSQFAAKWPFIDPNAVAESRAAIARGEYDMIEDLLDALQGSAAEASR